jgi:hypothetical protein
MSTRLYGSSDDLVCLEGMINEEYGASDRPVLAVFNDGTIAKIEYGMKVEGVWGIVVLKHGTQFLDFRECTDPESDTYTDELIMDQPLWVYFAENPRFAKALECGQAAGTSHD